MAINRNIKRIIARTEWIKDQLRSGKPWSCATLAAEFNVSLKTATRMLSAFRQAHPEWVVEYDAKERTWYLESCPINPPPRRIERLEMTGAEFLEIRHRLNLTHEQLGKCLDVAAPTFGEYERGDRCIPTDIVKLMRAWDRAREFGHWRGRKRKICRK